MLGFRTSYVPVSVSSSIADALGRNELTQNSTPAVGVDAPAEWLRRDDWKGLYDRNERGRNGECESGAEVHVE
jgi:hypothetical protein